MCGLSLAALAPSALATDYTWTGNGFGPNWFDTNNWSPSGIPDLTSVVTFPNSAGAIAVNNSVTTDFQTKSITIDTTTRSIFALHGTHRALYQQRQSDPNLRHAGNHTIGIPVYLGGAGNWTINGSGYLSVGSINESTAGVNFTKNGTGTLYVNTATYTGTTTISAGTLLVDSDGLVLGRSRWSAAQRSVPTPPQPSPTPSASTEAAQAMPATVFPLRHHRLDRRHHSQHRQHHRSRQRQHLYHLRPD